MTWRKYSKLLLHSSKQLRPPPPAKRSLPRSATIRSLSSSSSVNSDNIVRSKAPDVDIPKKHFFDCVWSDSVAKWAERTALTNGVTGESFNYRTCFRESSAFAAVFRRFVHLSKGDVVALLLPNCPEYAFLMTGCSLVGAPTTTVNPTYTASEIARQLKMSKARAVVTNDFYAPRVREAVAKLESSITVLSMDAERDGEGGVLAFRALRDKISGNPDPEYYEGFDFEEDLVALPYSSGTTGLPKGVMLPHRCMVSNIMQMVYAKGFDFVTMPTETYQPRTVCILPFFHVFGMNVTMFPVLHAGGQVVTLPSFEPTTFVKALETYKPTFLHLVPPLVSFLANHPSVRPDHLDSLEFIMVGAAPVGVALTDMFKKKAPQVTFREGWGMTELSPVATMTPSNNEVKGSCGLAIPNTLFKIADVSTGEALGPNKRGELCVKGPQVMKGYLDNPEATAATVKDGWLHSGDIGYYDDSEHFYIVDRLKELIKVKGLQVPPAELENLLQSHPDILDAAVIGVPDAKTGEAPRAYVVLKTKGSLTEEQVAAFVAAEASEHKWLRGGVQFVNAVPRSAAGKILRKDLLGEFLKQQQQQN